MSKVGTKVGQFVNVVTESGGLCSLRRIKASDLFYGSTEEALLAEREGKNAMAVVTGPARLPKPRITFDTSRPVDGSMDFLPFYGAASKIVCVDAAGQATLYDAGAASATVETLPGLHEPKGNSPIALSLARPGGAHDPARPDALYVLDTIRGSFEALVYGDPTLASPYQYRLARCPNLFVWHWRTLPPAPCQHHDTVRSYALLDGNTICVSSGNTDSFGTYFFDTAKEQWTKAGSWTLPFYGRAHAVPELDNLCFGIEDVKPHHLCALDLTPSMDGPPRVRHHWPDMDKPEGWPLEKATMAYMGAGRFCIAKTFDTATVLNGLEVVREDGDTRSESKLRMIRHKSVRYGLLGYGIRCVL